MTFTDRALIVGREKWRERDKRVTFFTEHHGLVIGTAIGAQKMTSKLSGHLEPLRLVDVMLATGKNGFTVAQAVTQQNFAHGASAESIAMLGLYARLATSLSQPGHADPVMFGLLYEAQKSAAAGAGDAGEFLCMLAMHAGLKPEFHECVLCASTENFKWFSPAQGGVVCANCVKPEGAIIYNATEKNQLAITMRLFFQWRGLC